MIKHIHKLCTSLTMIATDTLLTLLQKWCCYNSWYKVCTDQQRMSEIEDDKESKELNSDGNNEQEEEIRDIRTRDQLF
jgi:hypothetical protein